MKIIINADDLGISVSVNTEIEKAMNAKVISSATLITNAPAFGEGALIAKRHPEVSVGVHLNLIEFSPLTDGSIFKKYGIVGEDDCFIEGAIFSIEDYPQELKEAVKNEWCAQIEKYISAGLIPSHIDSHQHTHTIIALQDVLVEVMKKYNIKRVRRKAIPSLRQMLYHRVFGKIHIVYKHKTTGKRSNGHSVSKLLKLFQSKQNAKKWNRSMSASFLLTDHFLGFSTFVEFGKFLFCSKHSTMELMCHPGLDACKQETDVLFSKNIIDNKRYQLINYKQLVQ